MRAAPSSRLLHYKMLATSREWVFEPTMGSEADQTDSDTVV